MSLQNPKIFISYRRSDNADFVSLIRKEFVQHYGERNIFMDFYDIPYFTDFPDYIREKIQESDAMVVIIGPDWIRLLHEKMGRDDDYVRLEIALAIQESKLLAPVCIKGARMPLSHELPDNLKLIHRSNAPNLESGRDFERKVSDIINDLNAEISRHKHKYSGFIPSIDWVEIPKGEFIFGGNIECFPHNSFRPREEVLPTFQISRYPITYGQFQSFIDASDGFFNDEWWQGLALERPPEPGTQRWKIANHPREHVSWYDAVAFCRWLSSKTKNETRLPTELEWEKAARGTQGYLYPWGDEYISGYANVDETAERTEDKLKRVGDYKPVGTTPVNTYEKGKSPYGVYDMSGNVWEWCLNEYDDLLDINLERHMPRTIRGCSWRDDVFRARTTFRDWHYPDHWAWNQGFRVVTGNPI